MRRRRNWTGVVLISAAALVLLAFVPYALLPNLSTGPEPADRIKCASNLRQIGQGIWIYAQDHNGRFPDTMEQLYLNVDLTPEPFVCPTSGDTPATGLTRELTASDLMVGGHLSYVYVGTGLTVNAHPDTVVMYEDPAHHGGDGGNVLFGDIRVEWLTSRELRSVVDLLAAGKGPVVLTRNRTGQFTTTMPGTQPATQPVAP